jgi:glycosyltransferase involved in cell wall biosynthesis
VESQTAALERAGHEVALIAVRTDDIDRTPAYALRSGIQVATGRGRSPGDAIEAFGPDIVHVHNLFPNYGTRWAKHVDVPMAVTLHNFRPLCANGGLYRDGHVCTLCPDGRRFSGLRYACYRNSRLKTLPLTLANRGGPMAHPVLRRADRIIVLSDLARRIYRDAGVPDARLTVWTNFLTTDLDPGVVAAPNSTKRWLYVGRVSREKGIIQLAATWPDDRELVVVGDGPDMPSLQAVAVGKRVILEGFQPRSVVIDLMRTSMGMVFPSMTLESFPMVYVEALATGLPVLAWEPNVLANLVRDHGTGLSTAWSADLRSVLRAADDAFPGLRTRCRAVFEDKLSEQAFVARAEGMYEHMAEARSN